MPIPSFTPGQILTAAQLNTISTALPIVDAWTSYTPTLTQSVTVTKTVTYARYIKVGRMVTVSMSLAITSAGTAANAIVIGLPPFAPVVSANLRMGMGTLQDASASNWFTFMPSTLSTTTFRLKDVVDVTLESYVGDANGGFALAVASGDNIDCTFTYESTT